MTLFKRLHILLIAVLITTSSLSAFSQTSTTTNTRRSLAAIIFAGLGGAVLGLSTLSFYGQPQEHIGNITTGFALGLLAGSAYVLSQTNSSETSESAALKPYLPFQQNQQQSKKAPPLFVFNFEF